MKRQKCRAINIVIVSENIMNGCPLLSSLLKIREKSSYFTNTKKWECVILMKNCVKYTVNTTIVKR